MCGCDVPSSLITSTPLVLINTQAGGTLARRAVTLRGLRLLPPCIGSLYLTVSANHKQCILMQCQLAAAPW